MHEELLDCLLEKEKLRRAAEIVRRRAAGYEIPADPITTEAYLHQAAVQLEEIRRESLRLREERLLPLPRAMKRNHLEREAKERSWLATRIGTYGILLPQERKKDQDNDDEKRAA